MTISGQGTYWGWGPKGVPVLRRVLQRTIWVIVLEQGKL